MRSLSVLTGLATELLFDHKSLVGGLRIRKRDFGLVTPHVGFNPRNENSRENVESRIVQTDHVVFQDECFSNLPS